MEAPCIVDDEEFYLTHKLVQGHFVQIWRCFGGLASLPLADAAPRGRDDVPEGFPMDRTEALGCWQVWPLGSERFRRTARNGLAQDEEGEEGEEGEVTEGGGII